MPDEIYTDQFNIVDPGFTPILSDESFSGSTRYVRGDLVDALKRELFDALPAAQLYYGSCEELAEKARHWIDFEKRIDLVEHYASARGKASKRIQELYAELKGQAK